MDGLLTGKVELIGNKGLRIPRLWTKSGENVFDKFGWEKRSSVIRNPDGSVVFEMHNIEIPKFWSQNALDILAQKYFRKRGVPQFDKEGKPLLDSFGNPVLGSETSLKQVVHRLAGCWTYWGKKYGYFASEEDAQAFYDEIVYMLIAQMAAPNSPQWFNTGLNWAYGITGPAQGHYYVDSDTKQLTRSSDAYSHPAPHACFILPVKDDLVNEGGIMDLWVKEARIFKYGSGVGENYSNLRGKGEHLSGGGVSSGVMSFLKIGDMTGGSIKSGGVTRRAAKMVVLNIDHPEIEDFIMWKVNEEKKFYALVKAGLVPNTMEAAGEHVFGQHSNNSVRATDEYMKAVIEDKDWELTARTDGKAMKTVKARYLWDKIAESAWACADPGLQFDTTFNDWHTCPASGRINATNPCSEYAFLDNTACNLASINLGKFLDDSIGTFDTEAFKHAIRLWTIVLEISVLMAQFPSKEVAQLSYDFRTLGLGYTNLGSVLMRLGIPYDSDKGRTICAAITAMMTGESYATSAEMASFLGTFPRFEKNREHMLRVIRNHRRVAYSASQDEYEGLNTIPVGIDHNSCPQYLLNAAIESWDRALLLGEEYGYRNAQATLIAPTGTISFVMDADTTGIEPDFALVKFKKLAGGGYFKIINWSVFTALKNLSYTQQQIEDIAKYIVGTNSLKGAPYINDLALKRRGFADEDIQKIEKSLPSVFEIQFTFNVHTLGKDCLERLGFKPEQYNSPTFDLLNALGFTQAETDAANEYVCGTMTVEGAPHLKEEHYSVFDCANKCGKKGKRFIDYMAHVKMMAVAQPFLSGSISKTINMPNEATVVDVQKVYMESWKLALKSLALYRDGSKSTQPLSTTAEEKKEVKVVYKPIRRRLPDERMAVTHKFRIGNQEGYLTVGLYDDGIPGELFITMSKEGSTLSGLMDSFATSISIALQYGVPLKVLVNKFAHSRFEPSGWTDNPQIQVAKSVMDYIFRWLALKFLPKEELSSVGFNGDVKTEAKQEILEKKDGDVVQKFDMQSDAPACNDCGNLMIRSGSCYVCTACGTTSGCS